MKIGHFFFQKAIVSKIGKLINKVLKSHDKLLKTKEFIF
jgi:hypothetical protein